MAPGKNKKEPAGHNWQPLPSPIAKDPGEQLSHASWDLAPPLAPEPAGQFKQAGSESVKPVLEPPLYLPGAHGCVQLDWDVDPAAAVEKPAGHTIHPGSAVTTSAALFLLLLPFDSNKACLFSIPVSTPARIVFSRMEMERESSDTQMFPMKSAFVLAATESSLNLLEEARKKIWQVTLTKDCTILVFWINRKTIILGNPKLAMEKSVASQGRNWRRGASKIARKDSKQ